MRINLIRTNLVALALTITSFAAFGELRDLRYDYNRPVQAQCDWSRFESALQKVGLRAIAGGGVISGAVCTTGPCTLDNTVIGGTTPLAITGTTITATTKFLAGDGTAAAPSISLTNLSNAGFFKNGSALGVSVAGSIVGYIDATGPTFNRLTLDVGNSDLVIKRYAAKQVSITGDGIGASTNAGWALGYYGSGAFAWLMSTSSIQGAVSVTNGYALLQGASGDTYLNSVSGQVTDFRINNSSIATVSSTGLAMAAGKSVILATPAMTATAPTIASGGCTSPAVTWSNGTAAFLLTIGTACAEKTITLTMPAATNLWACRAEINTSDAAQAANDIVARATTTTAVVLTNYARVTGLSANFTSSDTILVSCVGG